MSFRAVLFALAAVVAVAAASVCDDQIAPFSASGSASVSTTGQCVSLTFDCEANICAGVANGNLPSNNSVSLYFTNFNTHIVGKIQVTYGDTEFNVPTTTPLYQTIAHLGGADGIIANPGNSAFLLVGGQGGTVYNVKIADGTYTTMSVPAVAYHLSAVSNSRIIYTNVSPSSVGIFDVANDGTLSNPRNIPKSSNSDSAVTTVIPVLSSGQFFYTTSGSGGGASSFGIINFHPDVQNPTSYSTQQLNPSLNAHSGVYDPYSGYIIVYGSNIVSQVDFSGHVYSQKNVGSGVQIDQGGIDGFGRAFLADNNGKIIYLSWRGVTGKKIENAFLSSKFIENSLDDIAPLIGLGGTC